MAAALARSGRDPKGDSAAGARERGIPEVLKAGEVLTYGVTEVLTL